MINLTCAKIDLTCAKIGDKFNTDGEFTVGLVHKSADDTRFCLEQDGSLFILLRDGSSKHLNITSKHDPRPWLKDLPDADLFHGDVEFIHCIQGDWCYLIAGWMVCHKINIIKMPKLTADQWEDSKISITDLRAWQFASNRPKGGMLNTGQSYIVGECDPYLACR